MRILIPSILMVMGGLLAGWGQKAPRPYVYYHNASTEYNDDHVTQIIGIYGDETDLTYDAPLRIKTKKKIVDVINYTTNFTTGTYGNITKAVYPAGITVSKVSDSSGSLTVIKLQDGGSKSS